MAGPQVSTLFDILKWREFGDVNTPAPFNQVVQSLAAVGIFDETIDGDVRMPWWGRTVLETGLPFGREIFDPITGGPSDPARQQRLGIAEDDGFLESTFKSLVGIGAGGLGLEGTTPTDVRGVTARTASEIDEVILELRLQGILPPAAP